MIRYIAQAGRKEWEAEPKSYFATNAADEEWQKGIPRNYAVSAIRLAFIAMLLIGLPTGYVAACSTVFTAITLQLPIPDIVDSVPFLDAPSPGKLVHWSWTTFAETQVNNSNFNMPLNLHLWTSVGMWAVVAVWLLVVPLKIVMQVGAHLSLYTKGLNSLCLLLFRAHRCEWEIM